MAKPLRIIAIILLVVAGRAFNAAAQTVTTLHSIRDPPDGLYPLAGLVQGSDGNFYGTTFTYGHCCGTVFRISPSGTYTTLYYFAGSPTDGYLPVARLVQGSDGNFYGTTDRGGTSNDGTVFRISPSGTETVLYSFVGPPTDGDGLNAGLAKGSDDNFYGTTDSGGTSTNNPLCPGGCGTVFRISPSGSETTLYSFVGYPTDGNLPNGLVQGSDGNFYGTTQGGGTSGHGTVFKLTVPLNLPANQISGIQLFTVFDTMDVAVSIPSVAGETYQLQYSDSLSPLNWINTGGTITSIGGPLILPDFAESLPPQRFYRAVITP